MKLKMSKGEGIWEALEIGKEKLYNYTIIPKLNEKKYSPSF